MIGDGRDSLDLPAPLFVVEEEGLLPGRVVDVRNEQRTADVGAEYVIAQLRTSAFCPVFVIEIVVSIESVVAIELPSFAVELAACRS